MLSSFQDRAAVLLAAVTFSVLSCCPGSVTAITNSHDHLPASQLPLQQHFTQLQYSSITDQLSRGQLSPQEQSHILTDIQQHRFLVNVNEGLRQEQSKAQTSFQQDPIKSGQHSLQQHPKHPPLFPPQQTFHHHFPQDSFQVGNIASTFANIYHSDKKPILLQPTYPQEYKSQSPQLQSVHHLKKNPTQQSFPQSTFQQTPQTLHQPKQSFQSGFQQTPQTLHQPQQSFPQSTFQQNLQLPPPAAPHFDSTKNFVASGIENKTPKHQQYLTEVPQPKAPPQAFQSDAHTLAPPKYRTQSWVLETQPPTPYKTQKPYDAITFATESYKPATPTPRVVKYRPSPKIQEEKNREEEQSDVFNKQDRKKLYEQLVDSALHASTPRSVTTKVPRRSSTTTAAIPTSTSRQIPDERYIQQQLQKQIQEQFHNKDNPFNTLKITLPVELSSEQIANLPNLALGDSLAQVPDLPSQLTSLAELPQSIFMANGQKVKLGASSDGWRTGRSWKHTKFSTKESNICNIGRQPDGSVKVQGVRGNENVQTDSKESDVEAIIERLKKGEIRLPPSTKLSTAGLATPQESQASPNYVKQEKNKTSVKPILGAKRRQSTTKSPIFIPSTPQANTHAGPVYLAEDYNSKWPTTTALPTRNRPEYTLPKRKDIPSFLPTVTSSQNTANKVAISQAAQPASQHSLSNYNYSPTPTSSYSPQTASTPTTSENHVTTPLTPSQSSPSVAALTNTLRANGLFAMAKFLRQSGLDSVLNGTDAYTLFVPTDKAFRALLVQLGGPDRAELKFKENPRLLSGVGIKVDIYLPFINQRWRLHKEGYSRLAERMACVRLACQSCLTSRAKRIKISTYS
uniref:FAS1 domain-containing protein n=1 Tax=Rhodnius prolixus TaxID=13249 RepID=T1HAL0_RHOPR